MGLKPWEAADPSDARPVTGNDPFDPGGKAR
jgi:hypothetical protein